MPLQKDDSENSSVACVQDDVYVIEVRKRPGSVTVSMKARFPHDGIVTEHQLIEKEYAYTGDAFEKIIDLIDRPAMTIWLLGEKVEE